MQLTQKPSGVKPMASVKLDDHIQRLFYAIWIPTIGMEPVNKAQLGENNETANILHEKRLAYLYGDVIDTTASSFKVSDEETAAIFRFAQARLELARTEAPPKEVQPADPLWEWFDRFIGRPDKHSYVFGEAAQKKLVAAEGNVHQWLQQLKTEYDTEQRELQATLEQELGRKGPSDLSAVTPKWEIHFTIITSSHSIRQSVLTAFNKKGGLIQLFPGANKQTLVIHVIRGSNVTLKDLWADGWLSCKLFVAALNIGANGFFYWNLHKDVDRYYDEFRDLQTNKRPDMRWQRAGGMDWKALQLTLTEQHIVLSFLVYEYLQSIPDPKEASPFTIYLAGLAMLAKTDIHLDLSLFAFDQFFTAFRTAITLHENADDTMVAEKGYYAIEGLLKGRAEFDRIVHIAGQLKKNIPEMVSIQDVYSMKRYCEYYLLTVAVRNRENDNSVRLTSMAATDSETSP
jgi:DnaJ-domain-containing protein 1